MTDDDPLQPHREQAARCPDCCRKMAGYYSQLGERHREAAEQCERIVQVYWDAARRAGTWDVEDEGEEA